MEVKEESEKAGLKLNIQNMKIMASGPITSWQIDKEKMTDFIFLGSKITVNSECSHEIKRRLLLGRKAMNKPRQCIKKQRHHFASKGPYSPSYSFSSSHLWMWKLDHKEGWKLKNWCFRTVVLKKTLESLLDNKIRPVNPKGNQSWIFIGWTDAEAEAAILWPPDVESWLTGRDPNAEKTGCRRTGWQRMRWLDASLTQWTLSKLQERVKDREAWCPAAHRVPKCLTWLSNWTTAEQQHTYLVVDWWISSYQNNRDAAQNKLNCFCFSFTSWYAHSASTIHPEPTEEAGSTEKKRNCSCSIFSFQSLLTT